MMLMDEICRNHRSDEEEVNKVVRCCLCGLVHTCLSHTTVLPLTGYKWMLRISSKSQRTGWGRVVYLDDSFKLELSLMTVFHFFVGSDAIQLRDKRQATAMKYRHTTNAGL